MCVMKKKGFTIRGSVLDGCDDNDWRIVTEELELFCAEHNLEIEAFEDNEVRRGEREEKNKGDKR